jgi:hypothetical protein
MATVVCVVEGFPCRTDNRISDHGVGLHLLHELTQGTEPLEETNFVLCRSISILIELCQRTISGDGGTHLRALREQWIECHPNPIAVLATRLVLAICSKFSPFGSLVYDILDARSTPDTHPVGFPCK